jgi:hypothetical protein
MRQGNSLKPYYLLLKRVTIPERSFLRSAFDKKDTVDKAMAMARVMLQRLLGGSATAEDVLSAIGSSLASSVKNNIASNIGPVMRRSRWRLSAERAPRWSMRASF